MSKRKKLTEEDMRGYEINPIILHLIDSYIRENSIKKEDIRILDYGSGRGKLVAGLRELGFQAFGVEIDPLPLNNGLEYFTKLGYNPYEFLHLIQADCKTIFDDNFFDIVLSEQVLEHVEDIDIVVQELSRVTKINGVHFHKFPSKRFLLEQHLFMPIVHWLPKNILRKWAIFMFVKLGIEPFWELLNTASTTEKTNAYYRYSVEQTYYRSVKELRSILHKYGFTTSHQYLYKTGKGIKAIVAKFFPVQVILTLRKAAS